MNIFFGAIFCIGLIGLFAYLDTVNEKLFKDMGRNFNLFQRWCEQNDRQN
jgi:hypothetical protein